MDRVLVVQARGPGSNPWNLCKAELDMTVYNLSYGEMRGGERRVPRSQLAWWAQQQTAETASETR